MTNLCNNYRRVSLTSVIVKCMRQLLKMNWCSILKVKVSCPSISMAFVHHLSALLNFYKLWMIGPNLHASPNTQHQLSYQTPAPRCWSLVTQLMLCIWTCIRLLIVCLTDNYWLIHMVYCIAGKFGGEKVWWTDSFRAFGKRKFSELIDLPIDY